MIVFYFISNSVCLTECESMNRTCARTGECCPEQCLGGCIRDLNHNNNDDDDDNNDDQINWKCFSCKKFRYQNRCYDTCPNGSYAVSD